MSQALRVVKIVVSAEIHAPRIPRGRRLAMIVRMILLDQRVVPFAYNFPRFIVDN